MNLNEALKTLKQAGYLTEYTDAIPEPSTFGKTEYLVDYNWWPSDKPEKMVMRQDKIWLVDPNDDDEIINVLSDILGEGTPEIEIISVT